MTRRLRWLNVLALGWTIAACGDDPAPSDNITCEPGSFCECQSDDDCPTGEVCDPFTATCRADEGDTDVPDAGEDTGEDTTPDVAEDPGVDTPDVGPDTTPEVGPDTPDVQPDIDTDVADVPDVIDPLDADTDVEPDVPVDTCPPITEFVSNPWVAYLSDEVTTANEFGVYNLWVVRLDGATRQEIPIPATEEPQVVSTPAWSPDGRTLVAVTLGRLPGQAPPAPPTRRLWIIDVESGDYQFRQIPELAFFSNPSFSPDGTQLIMDGRATVDGSSQIWAYDIETGAAPTAITADTVNSGAPRWHRCGRVWFVRSITEQIAEVYSVLPDGTDEQPVTTGSRLLGRISVSPDEAELYYVRRTAPGSEESEVVSYDIEALEPTVIADGSFDVLSLSPDGRFIGATVDRLTDLDVVVIDSRSGTIQAEPVSRDADETSAVLGPIESDLVTIDFRE